MGRYKAIALDMMGVVYPVGDDLRDIVIPFLRELGSPATAEDVIGAYRLCYRGQQSSTYFWNAVGMGDRQESVQALLMQQYSLTPGAVDFLTSLQQEGVPVFALSNDIAEWAPARRRLLGIDQYFSSSVVSGAHGAVKPQPEIYRILVDQLPCAPEDCLFVDDRVANLDGAVPHGFATALFGAIDAAPGHLLAPDFQSLRAICGLGPDDREPRSS